MHCNREAALVAGLIASCLLMLTAAVDYTGYKVYEVSTGQAASDAVLRARLEGLGYNILSKPGGKTLALVAPDRQAEFESAVKKESGSYKITHEDVERAIAEEREHSQRNKRAVESFQADYDFSYFPRFQDMLEILDRMVSGSKYARIVRIGTSYEGRPIVGVRLQSSPENPVIFVDATIHAREWAAPIVALYLIKRIVQMEDSYARKATIIIVPMANPDGYEFTHSEDRFWRKSRSIQPNSTCQGVDINRNFDSHWGEFGVDFNPCSDTYPGFAPFTELEATAIAHAIRTLKPVMYLTIHSYGPLLLYPYGFTHYLPQNWKELDALGRNATAALKRVNGQHYVVGSSTNVLYLASGGSDDWAMQKIHVPLVYTMELPEYGQGFVVPLDKIQPMVKETFAAFKVFVEYVCRKYEALDCARQAAQELNDTLHEPLVVTN